MDNVILPLLYWRSSERAREQAEDALERVGLSERANHSPMELSVGERQRVAIARALITDPASILADEPTGNLDSKTGEEVMKLLADLNSEGRTILMVTHNADIASFAQRTLRMHDGLIINGSADDVAA